MAIGALGNLQALVGQNRSGANAYTPDYSGLQAPPEGWVDITGMWGDDAEGQMALTNHAQKSGAIQANDGRYYLSPDAWKGYNAKNANDGGFIEPLVKAGLLAAGGYALGGAAGLFGEGGLGGAAAEGFSGVGIPEGAISGGTGIAGGGPISLTPEAASMSQSQSLLNYLNSFGGGAGTGAAFDYSGFQTDPEFTQSGGHTSFDSQFSPAELGDSPLSEIAASAGGGFDTGAFDSGQFTSQDVGLGQTNAFGRPFAASGVADSPVDQLKKLYKQIKPYSGAFDVLKGLYGMKESRDVGKLAGPGISAATSLKNLIDNPGAITQLPGYQELLAQRTQGLRRQMAAAGYNMSGNEMAAIADLGGKQYLEFRDQEMNRLQQMISSSLPPTVAASQSRANSLNSILYGVGRLIG